MTRLCYAVKYLSHPFLNIIHFCYIKKNNRCIYFCLFTIEGTFSGTLVLAFETLIVKSVPMRAGNVG